MRIKQSYVVLGASRGLGVRFISSRLANVNCSYAQIGFVRALCKNPDNTVFALVRNPDDATDLRDLVNASTNKNIHVVKADLDSLKSLEVSTPYIS